MYSKIYCPVLETRYGGGEAICGRRGEHAEIWPVWKC